MQEIKLLDHGYIKLIESWGSEERIIEAARMSTNKGFIRWGDENYPGDEKLLRYLYVNKHTSPFEMAGMTIEVQAPIFVFREWMRHRTQSYSELSARYTPIPNLNYIPSVERLMMDVNEKNKQAGRIKDANEMMQEVAEWFREELKRTYATQQGIYNAALLSGVPKELARIHLPVGRYSRMRASANLLNWLKFLTLRMAPNAQYEIRVYADALGSFVEKLFPRTWSLFLEKNSI